MDAVVRGDFYFEETLNLKDEKNLGSEQRRRVLGRGKRPLKQEQVWPVRGPMRWPPWLMVMGEGPGVRCERN